jgi:VIT1/CCC1 family predicted Fe2+/Mn2+ transporter
VAATVRAWCRGRRRLHRGPRHRCRRRRREHGCRRRCRRRGRRLRCAVDGRRRVRLRGAQRDTEDADIARETWELANQADEELDELAGIYESRGLEPELARQVAVQLTKHDALATHLREELAIDQTIIARPWQAAWLSAVSFAVGAVAPVLAITLAPDTIAVPATVAVTIALLVVAGGVASHLGRSRIRAGAIRVAIGGAVAMGVTWAVGRALGANIS